MIEVLDKQVSSRLEELQNSSGDVVSSMLQGYGCSGYNVPADSMESMKDGTVPVGEEDKHCRDFDLLNSEQLCAAQCMVMSNCAGFMWIGGRITGDERVQGNESRCCFRSELIRFGPQQATACYIKSRAQFLAMNADSLEEWLQQLFGSRKFSDVSKEKHINGLMMSVLTVSKLQEYFTDITEEEVGSLHCHIKMELGEKSDCVALDAKAEISGVIGAGKAKLQEVMGLGSQAPSESSSSKEKVGTPGSGKASHASRFKAAFDFVDKYKKALWVTTSFQDLAAQMFAVADVSSLASSVSYLLSVSTEIKTCEELMNLLEKHNR